MATQKRTPAQIRATKKLVALNKKRAKAKRNPAPARKRRTAAQIRATKKLIAANKARANSLKKTVATRRKKSNPATSYSYRVVIKNRNNGKMGYFTGVGFSENKRSALVSRSKQTMETVARAIPASRIGKDWDLAIEKNTWGALGK